MQKAIYQKPFKTVAEQIALLEGRGLSVDIDASDFAAFLRSVNYYRFTGYAIPFQVDREHFAKDAKASDFLRSTTMIASCGTCSLRRWK